ncbi:hypothetical protein H6P81_013374 [Aristolochia fimbriata]|uniref:RNase H type-1 domain-containing protein n=1 Tax=Aristolochia fimbriata TaxID=158543 RepID=A0AAV7EFQ8_ARIFI|nr:hypothetical protein H6P81_013374 [Aristolochia fimbriata]
MAFWSFNLESGGPSAEIGSRTNPTSQQHISSFPTQNYFKFHTQVKDYVRKVRVSIHEILRTGKHDFNHWTETKLQGLDRSPARNRGPKMSKASSAPQLEVYGDSALVIKQITSELKVKKVERIPFWRQAGDLLANIPYASLHYISRTGNGPADALAEIAASLPQFDNKPSRVPVCKRWVVPLPIEEKEDEVGEKEESLPISICESEIGDWRDPITNFLRHGALPANLRERVHIRRTAPRFIFKHDILFRRSYEGLLLRCLSKEEVRQVLHETHGGICCAHQAGLMLHTQVKRLGYYWPSMLRDAIEMARACKPCQFHANYIHQPLEPLHPTVASWSFEAWGVDIIGPITPNPILNDNTSLLLPVISPNG